MSLTLAIPSKGRLKEQALEVLAKAGLPVSLPDDARKYHARVDGRADIEVVFLSASEIAGEIGQGAVDLGRRRHRVDADIGFGERHRLARQPPRAAWRASCRRRGRARGILQRAA